MTVFIYGASDDLIEIEGDISEEFYYYGEEKPVYLALSNGMVFTIRYDGEWIIRSKFVSPNRAGDYIVHLADTPVAVEKSGRDYSDVLEIRGQVDWVVAGTDYAK